MNWNDLKARCPVCGMEVDPADNALEYEHMHFAFCSQQCRERFVANPYLYIGYKGRKAPKQEGREVIKRRRLRLARPLSEDMAQRVVQGIRAMMGIKDVRIDGDRIQITYDLLQATAAQIEAELARVGAGLGEGWSENLRRAFVHYMEETEVENLEVRPGAPGGSCH